MSGATTQVPGLLTIDIETQTGPVYDDQVPDRVALNGLDPARSLVTDVQLASDGQVHHLKLDAFAPKLYVDGDGMLIQDVRGGMRCREYELDGGTQVVEVSFLFEPDLLDMLVELLADARYPDQDGRAAEVLVSWNGSGFDLPFLADRAAAWGKTLDGLQLQQDPDRSPKYGPLPGHGLDGATGAYKARWFGLPHLDAAYLYRDFAEKQDVRWSLKPVATARGVEMVEVDASRMHELSDEERNAYAVSDVMGLHQLIVADWHRVGAADSVDRLDG